jgi:uncharacterized protein
MLKSLALLVAIFLIAGCSLPVSKADKVWWSEPETIVYDDYERFSQYLTMRDGVKIAVTVHLPEGLPIGERIPTVLHLTRYFREIDFRAPFGSILGQMEQALIERLTAAGYAFVLVDVRGTGASFGTRDAPWSKIDVADGVQVADWIIAQPWSDGIIGASGDSYAGTAAELFTTAGHPAVKALFLRFAPFDLYADVAFPGGTKFDWLVDTWNSIAMALDANAPENAVGFAIKLAARGVMPVDGDEDRVLLNEAVKQHESNYSPAALINKLEYRDDTFDERGFDDISPHVFIPELKKAGIPTYSYSGWFDGAYPNGSIKRFMNVPNPGSKMVLGPWPHDGFEHVNPSGKTKTSGFDMVGEIIRFFDFHLRGIDRGISTEPPIHYYTMGQDQWKTSETWPPPNASSVEFFFSGENRLKADRPAEPDAFDLYQVNPETGTSDSARWNSIANITGASIAYPDRKERDRLLLCYDSPPLEADMIVTGHPVITLFVESPAPDGQFFAYLEELDEEGNVFYVTEGMLRAIHRKLSDAEPPYSFPAPYRTFNKADAAPLAAGEVARLTFDLIPVSHRFKKGHSIRIAIAGADKDHFPVMPGDPPEIRVHRNSNHPSGIVLPVEPK